jgi:hypothetical protein
MALGAGAHDTSRMPLAGSMTTMQEGTSRIQRPLLRAIMLNR